ncbi:hypothetical protein AAFH68_41730 [Flavobacterium sp. CGRL1]
MEEKQNKRKQNVLLLVVIGIALALAVFFQFFLSEKSDEVKTEVTELVEKYNKSCPLKNSGRYSFRKCYSYKRKSCSV